MRLRVCAACGSAAASLWLAWVSTTWAIVGILAAGAAAAWALSAARQRRRLTTAYPRHLKPTADRLVYQTPGGTETWPWSSIHSIEVNEPRWQLTVITVDGQRRDIDASFSGFDLHWLGMQLRALHQQRASDGCQDTVDARGR